MQCDFSIYTLFWLIALSFLRLKIIPPKFIQYLNWSPIVTRRNYHLGSSVLFCFEYKIFAVIIEYHWFKTEKMFQSRMPTESLKKSSLVPDFLFSLLQLFTHVTVHSAQYLLRLNTLLVSVCSKDLLICFADHWRGEWDWCVGRHFHEFYNFFSTYYCFFLYIFFTHNVLPTPTTHDPRHLVTLSLNCL